MADDGATTRRRRAEPASPRTLRAWRLIGLVLGTPAAVLLVAGPVVALLDLPPGRGPVAVLLTGGGVLLALLAVVFLQRVWSEPRHPRTRWTAVGDRLATAFLALWGLGVLGSAVQAVFEVELPAAYGTTLFVLAAVSFLATLGVAYRVPALREA